MDLFSIVRYLHFVSIFIVVGTLFFEAFTIKSSMTRKEIAYLSKIDGLYGLGAILVVTFGLWMWLGDIGKPSDFYTKNWILHSKVGMFIVIGILSIWPTIFFTKQRKGDPEEAVEIPGHIRKMIYLEIFLLLIIPLLNSS